VQYTVKVEQDKHLTPVQAFWLRANGCGGGAGYYINGDGTPGSTTDAVYNWTVPYDMKLIAAGGHLHGGAKDMFLSQPRCGDRRLLDNKPSYAMPDNLYYRARPVLHEPGPIDTRWFLSGQGIQANKGETINLHGLYEATYPRTVMSVMHLYVVKAKPAADASCQPLPSDIRQVTKPIPTRADPPHEDIPLTGLDKSGHTFTITDPPWPIAPLPTTNAVKVSDAGFSPQRFTVAANTKVTWDFEGAAGHNVRLAAGPRLVVTPTYPRGGVDATTFTVPGTYTLFCTRHPVTMHAEVQVTS
jgi:plastocyanin